MQLDYSCRRANDAVVAVTYLEGDLTSDGELFADAHLVLSFFLQTGQGKTHPPFSFDHHFSIIAHPAAPIRLEIGPLEKSLVLTWPQG